MWESLIDIRLVQLLQGLGLVFRLQLFYHHLGQLFYTVFSH